MKKVLSALLLAAITTPALAAVVVARPVITPPIAVRPAVTAPVTAKPVIAPKPIQRQRVIVVPAPIPASSQDKCRLIKPCK